MAIKYVDSSAAGLNDGTSWANAWTSIASSSGVAAGDSVYIASGHSESGTATVDWTNGTNANPVIISSRNTGDDSYTIAGSAQLTAADLIFDGDIRVYGLFWSGIDDAFFDPQDGRQEYYDCTFEAGDKIAPKGPIRFVGCTFKHDGFISTMGAQDVEYVNCSFDMKSNYIRAGIVTGENDGTKMRFSSCTFGNYDATLTKIVASSAAVTMDVSFNRCNFPSGKTFCDNDVLTVARAFNCGEGTITDPALGVYGMTSYAGTVSTSLSRYRTGGADDGEQANAYSYEMTTTANALEQFVWIETPPMAVWLDGTETTIKVYVASGGTLNNDDFWVSVESPDEAGSATAQTDYEDSKIALDGTPAALTTDASSTWNGTGVGTKQEVSITIAPTQAGPAVVKAYLAKPSTTVYIDPLPEVS